MIHSRITAKSQTTIPRPVREALGVGPGDTLSYRIVGGEVVVSRARAPDTVTDLTARYRRSFPEWFDELDAEFDER